MVPRYPIPNRTIVWFATTNIVSRKISFQVEFRLQNFSVIFVFFHFKQTFSPPLFI